MPDDGLFKPKHVAYFTSYFELCMTIWRKKYICKVLVGAIPLWCTI